MLNTETLFEEIIADFNKDKEEDKQFTKKTNTKDIDFENISDYELYTRAAKTEPDWGFTFDNIVTDIGTVQNINHSFILFIAVGTLRFAVTGGVGYLVLDKYKRYDFGIDLLSRLITPTDNVIKRINDRYFTGNKVGSNFQYVGNVNINSEKSFNNFYKEIYLALPSRTIKKKLGVDIKTNKSDYSFLAKDSIKLGKAITLKELDTLLKSIENLLQKDGYSINPFYELDKDDPLLEQLNIKLVDLFKNYIQGESLKLNVIPFYYNYESHYIDVNGDNKKEYDNEQDIINFVKNHISLDKDNKDILKIMHNINLSAEVEGQTIIENSLFEHIDTKLDHDHKNYWLMEGRWYLLERQFIEQINNTFIYKIAESYDMDFYLSQMQSWSEGSEGEYNFNHNKQESVYVLDKIFIENIEVCDLLIEGKDTIYFIHVKDGLDGDVRTLVAQIESSLKTINDGLNHDRNVLDDYYKSIINKKKNETDSGKPTQLAKAAAWFKERFKNKEDFIDTISRKKKTFVFAYRPLDSHNLFKPETITSTAAKLSMIGLTETIKDYDSNNYNLEFLRIKR